MKSNPLDTNSNGDIIVYLVVTDPGGVDGRDHADKGGVIKFATTVKDEALGKKDSWSTIKTQVVNLKDAQAEARKKLNGLDRLVLGIE
jgi:hypothetical protein